MTGVVRTAVITLLASVLATPAALHAQPNRSDAARAGAAWLASRQEPDGTLPTYGGSGVGEALVSLLAGGVRGEPVDRALDFIRKDGADAASGPAKSARIVMGLVAAAQDPRSFHGTNYVARVENGYDATTGAYEENVYADALAALGVLAAADNLPGRAITYLKTNQCAMGGWAWRQACAGLPDVDTTAMVMSALLAAGLPRSDDAISRGRSWLVGAQNEDGGFPLEDGGETNANSTGLALSVIEAMDEDPRSDPWSNASGDPVGALTELQDESGGFRFKASDGRPGDYATVQAVPGLMGHHYPVPPITDRTQAPEVGEAAATDPPETRSPNRTTAPETNGRAGVVVYEKGEVAGSGCESFRGSITGEQLLTRADLRVVMSRTQLGAAVCKIGDTGCPAGDCFCKYPRFWNYWTRDSGDKEWSHSDVGASDRDLRDGSIDAWVWGTESEPPPEVRTIGSVCAVGTDRVIVGSTEDDEAVPRSGKGLLGFLGFIAVMVALAAILLWRRRRTA